MLLQMTEILYFSIFTQFGQRKFHWISLAIFYFFQSILIQVSFEILVKFQNIRELNKKKLSLKLN